MTIMMEKWLKKATPGDKGLTRPPPSVCVSSHKNEVRSMSRKYFQIQFRVTTYKQVGVGKCVLVSTGLSLPLHSVS